MSAPHSPSSADSATWPTDEQVWDCIRLTFSTGLATRLSFKRWKDGIDIDFPTEEAMSFARQLFAMGFAAASTGAPAQAVVVNAAALTESLIQAAVDYEAGRIGRPALSAARAAVEAAIAQPPAGAVETTPTKEDFAKWSRVWHGTCETMMTLLGLHAGGSPEEMLAEVQKHVGARCSAGNGDVSRIDPIESEWRPHTAAQERQDLSRQIRDGGVDRLTAALKSSAVALPSHGSLAGWLWAVAEWINTHKSALTETGPQEAVNRLTEKADEQTTALDQIMTTAADNLAAPNSDLKMTLEFIHHVAEHTLAVTRPLSNCEGGK